MSQTDPALQPNPPVDFAPVDLLLAAIRRWWLVSGLVVIGGLAGWLIFLFQPPVYEARASILVTIDFSNTGYLTQFEEDLMMDAVGNLLRAEDVAGRVATEARQQGINLDAKSFKTASSVERRLGTWELRIRRSSPEIAMRLANIWAEAGYSVLSDAYQHAVLAKIQAGYLNSLESCLSSASASERGSILCNGLQMREVQAELQNGSAQLFSEQLASRGIIAGTLLAPPQLAGLPGDPLPASRGAMILAGGLIGALLGFILGPLPVWKNRAG